jgi:hypothetical protein
MADTGLILPTTTANGPGGNWFNSIFNVELDDGSVTTGGSGVSEGTLTDFSFSIPGGATIDGIDVQAQHRDVCGDGSYYVGIFLSWDAGTTYTSRKDFFTASNPGSSFVDQIVGGSTDTWGRTWTVAELNNTNFQVRLSGAADPFPQEYQCDFIKARVYYTAAGGAVRRMTLLGAG